MAAEKQAAGACARVQVLGRAADNRNVSSLSPSLRTHASFWAALVMFASPLFGAMQTAPAPEGGAPATVASELVDEALNHEIEVVAPPAREVPDGGASDGPSPLYLLIFALAAVVLFLAQRLEAGDDPHLERLLARGSLEPRDGAADEARPFGIPHRPWTWEKWDRRAGGPQAIASGTPDRRAVRPDRKAAPSDPGQPPLQLPPHILQMLQRSRERRAAEGAPTESDPERTESALPKNWEIVLPAYDPWKGRDR